MSCRQPAGLSTAPSTSSTAVMLDRARSQLIEYFAGQRHYFDLPLAPLGTAFQRAVWSAVADVPLGQTATYTAIAARVEAPRAVRAVGAANGRNPWLVVVPCQRIVGADGALTGYAGGIERKRWLLEHERRLTAGNG